MRLRFLLPVLALAALFFSTFSVVTAQAEQTINCPNDEYDMLDWMTLDSDLRGSRFMTGNNPEYTMVFPGKFYNVKGPKGYPWDVNLFDDNYIYLWITEYNWNDPHTYKKFTYNTNMPLARRCAKGGYPGSTITVNNTWYDLHTDCSHYSRKNLGYAVNQVWGPYTMNFGGSINYSLQTMVISYRYNCNSSYSNCGDKEEYYLTQRYGMVRWAHYRLNGGGYELAQVATFNWLGNGSTSPYFPCF